jgi:2-methylcitrate dehydratase PrpD
MSGDVMSADVMSGDVTRAGREAVAREARRLLDWAAKATLADIPKGVLARAATVLTDDLAAMIGARCEPEVARFHGKVIERAHHREATVLRGGIARVARIDAAVANAVAANWLELDEGYRRTPCHAGLYILPALLATAETDNAPVEELLRAVVLAYEVVTRIARGWKQRALNMQSHGRYCAIGAATATALLRKLDADTRFAAVSAAATLVNPSPRTHLVAGALVRNVWPAQGAWSGMMAVEWAGMGIGGSPDAFYDVYSDVLGGAAQPEALTEGLGRDWALLEGYTKLYACCQHLHATVEALLDLRPALMAAGSVEAIESVEIATHALARPLMNARPETTLGAKFSLPHAVASALVMGSGGADAFAFDTLARPEIDALRQRVTVKAYGPELPPPNDRPSRAEIRLRGGRVLLAECISARGGADRPLPATTVDDKLAQLAVPVYPSIARVLAPIRALETTALRRGWRQTVDAFSH